MTKTAVVIGAGLAGIQVAQQLTDLGIVVHLIEKESIIGGLSTHLGRVFPTGDCALCLDASTEIFDGQHRRCQYRGLVTEKKNLKLHTLTEIRSISEVDGSFKISIKSQPRYVDLDRCVVCLECIEVCDVNTRDEYGVRGGTRKAIYRPIPQGVPLAPLIDMEHCTKCGKCVDICKVNAIDLEEKESTKTIKADALILATGVEEKIPLDFPGYEYSKSDDIITHAELARLLDPAGDTNGEVTTSSGNSVSEVTMVLCVGSRDLSAAEYCSQACCTYSLKHADMLRDRGIDVTICYMDLRVQKSSEHYLTHAREKGVKFLRGKPDSVVIRNGKPMTIVEDTQSQKRMEIESDLVVLASPLAPLAEQSDALSEFLGEYGFVSRIAKEGRIYACGTATGPTDIPTSIAEANAVALEVYSDLEGGV
ncbi:MAG: FAD-dependent oxidoreductase [Candidatus Thorarchaeota archaeon]